MNPYNFSLLFFAFCTFFISLLIWLKRQDQVGQIYFVFSIFVTLWGIGFSMMISQNISYAAALFCARVANATAIMIPVTWFHFSLVFSDNAKKHTRLLQGLYLLSSVLILFSFSPFFITNLHSVGSFAYFAHPGPIYHIFTAFFFLVIPLGFMQLFQKMKTLFGIERYQLKGLIIATAIGFMGGSLTFLPGYEIPFPQYGLFFMPIYPFAMAYFMIKQKLFDIEELAQAAHRDKLVAVGMLTASINHEIKNPLYIIHGIAEAYLTNLNAGLYQSPDEVITKSKIVVQKIIDQTHRVIEIMKRFADFTKPRINEEVLRNPVNLNQVLEGILPLIQHDLDINKITVENKIPIKIQPLLADQYHMEEILFNLIVNACHALNDQQTNGHSSGKKIVIFAMEQENEIMLIIKDNGPGIALQRLTHIFDPFYTTKKEGMGLGLYVTKRLVEKNGGKIVVDSTLGKGTSFLIKFEKLILQAVCKEEGSKF